MVFPSLYFRNSKNTWQPVPDWAQWFLQAGMLIGGLNGNETRMVLGISVPIRKFSAIMIALGVIYKRSEIHSEGHDCQAYFEFLKSLPPSTSVSILIDDNKKLKRRDGKIEGVCHDGHSEYISVIYMEDAGKHKTTLKKPFYVSKCRRITVTGTVEIDLSNPKTKGYSVVRNFSFLSKFLNEELVADFTTSSRLDCSLIGTKKMLSPEMECIFSVKDQRQKHIDGDFRDIIRPQNIYSYSQSYRSRVYSAGSKKPPDICNEPPWCVIFDSASGYMKWHDRFRFMHQVVIVDRTEKLHKIVAQYLNNRFYRRYNQSFHCLQFPAIPHGIEVISFMEKCHA